MKYLLDSNVVIDYLGGKFTGISLSKLNQVFDESFCIATITKIEVLGFKSGTTTFDNQTNNFISLATLYDLTSEVIEKTIEIRKDHKIKIADAIIAATAIVNKFTLLSHNTKDYSSLKGISVIDPYVFK